MLKGVIDRIKEVCVLWEMEKEFLFRKNSDIIIYKT